jgi:glycosyltransferase involved in cell wall biosynthesis
MKVSGFTFLRNAEINGYPFIESIRSILPIVDEFVCAIGPSDDNTKAEVQAINDDKIKIIETTWNENMQDRGFVYGQQKMVAQYNCSGDWAFYLEADEVLHEKELPLIQDAMHKHLHNPNVEAFYFNFYHFYGTANQLGIAGYRKAPRIIRNTIRTIAPDGLFWVVLDKNKKGRYPKAMSTGANIYHYGHCRSITKMAEKLKRVGKYWGRHHESFDGYGYIDLAEIRPFNGSHPKIMDWWLESEAEKKFEQDPNFKPSRRDKRNRVRFAIEKTLKVEISKKHFRALD